MKLGTICFTLFVFCSSAGAGNLVELNENNYASPGKNLAIIILQVNWGRAWGCAGNDNAQLIHLSFLGKSSTEDNRNRTYLEFETPSKLSPGDGFKPYVLLIEPGHYYLSGFEVRVAASKNEIGFIKATEEKLIIDGKSLAGSFYAEREEIIYLGHVGLDCNVEPIPWRYYIEGKSDFTKYAKEIKSAYPFLTGKKLLFRIIDTEVLGQPYSLGETFGVQM